MPIIYSLFFFYTVMNFSRGISWNLGVPRSNICETLLHTELQTLPHILYSSMKYAEGQKVRQNFSLPIHSIHLAWGIRNNV
jgi:hypothetical protein